MALHLPAVRLDLALMALWMYAGVRACTCESVHVSSMHSACEENLFVSVCVNRKA